MTTLEIYRKALDRYGVDAQLNMVVEELGELIAAINHWRRAKIEHSDLLQEIADVKIMIEQLELIAMVDHNELVRTIDFKLHRLAQNLEVKQ